VKGDLNNPQPIESKNGWVYLGNYRISDNDPEDFTGVDFDDLISYIHATQGFNHPDESVVRSKFDYGIVDNHNVIVSDDELPLVTIKEASDEMKDAKGNLSTVATRILGVIDVDGNIQRDPIEELAIQRILKLYFGSGDLEHPNPFRFNNDTGKFELNMDAVADTGEATYFIVSGRGVGPEQGGEHETLSVGESSNFLPNTYQGLSADDMYIYANAKKIQWGDGTNGLGIGTGNEVLGCNFRCRVHRDPNGAHRIGAWSQIDMPNGTEFSWGLPVEYMTIGAVNLKDGFADLPIPAPEGSDDPTDYGNSSLPGNSGSGTFSLSGIPTMTGESGKDWNKSCLIILHNVAQNRYIAIYQRYLLAHHSSYDPPTGYENAEYWPAWRVECGGYTPSQQAEWSIFSAGFLPSNELSEVNFEFAWNGQSCSVKCLETGDVQTVTNNVNLFIDSWGDGSSSAAGKFGTSRVNDASVSETSFTYTASQEL